jgi:hypothetical protein
MSPDFGPMILRGADRSSLNRHTHHHCCILDGVFEPRDDGSIRFLPAVAPTPQEIAAIAEQVRRRVLRWFARSGLLDAPTMPATCSAGIMATFLLTLLYASPARIGRVWSGFCVIARACPALEGLEQVYAQQVIYRLPKPRRDGRTALSLTPLELIEHGTHRGLAPCRVWVCTWSLFSNCCHAPQHLVR